MQYALSKLKLWDGNYNQGDVGAISLAIRKYGYGRGIGVWKEQQVRAGNTTVAALRLIQREGVSPGVDGQYPPANIRVDEDGEWWIEGVDMSHLSETDALGYAIADNRMAQRASQDETLLATYLSQLYELNPEQFEAATGYDEDDLQSMLAVAEPIVAPDAWKDPQEALDLYLNGQIKQIVIYFKPDEYLDIMARIEHFMGEMDVATNTDVFVKLMEFWEEHYASIENS